jgi:hypothetical protein
VRDRQVAADDPARIRFSPSILPPYMRRSRSIETLLASKVSRGPRGFGGWFRWQCDKAGLKQLGGRFRNDLDPVQCVLAYVIAIRVKTPSPFSISKCPAAKKWKEAEGSWLVERRTTNRSSPPRIPATFDTD